MNSGIATKWTPDNVQLAIEILGRHEFYRAALREIQSALGETVTSAALRGAFQRAGYEAPVRYLGVALAGALPSNVTRLHPERFAEPPPANDTSSDEDDDEEVTVDVDLSEISSFVDPTDRAVDSVPPADRSYVDRDSKASKYNHQIVMPSGEVEAHFYIPDMHFPFHDKEVWSLILKAAAHVRSRFARMRILILGDFLDCHTVSFHEKDPRRGTQLADEIRAANCALDQVQDIGADWVHFIEGNHENRLSRYLTNHAPALLDFDSLSIPELLGLHDRGWTFTPYRSFIKIGKLYATHDIGVAGAYALHRAGAAFEHNVVQGHTHRAGTHFFGNALNEAHVAASFGWGGDLSSIDYMYKVRASRDWQHGFGVGIMLPDGCVHLHAVPVVDNTAVVFGSVIRG